MKKYIEYTLLLCCLFSFVACGNDKDPISINYVLMARVTNIQADEIYIDTPSRTIFMKFTKGGDFSNASVRLTLAKGVEMIEPTEVESIYDFTKPASVTLKYKDETIIYHFDIAIEYDAIDPTSLGWVKSTEWGNLPDYLTVYKSPATLRNKNAVAYIAVADMNQGATFDVLGEKQGLKTPTQFYNAEPVKPAIVMNGGYFSSNGTTVSLLCKDGNILAPNLQSMSRSNGTSNVAFYPTRAAFGEMENGKFEVNWIYTVSASQTYAYPVPSPNKAGTAPMQVPSATYPSGAFLWKAKNAIGGGPVLLKNGLYKNTWEAELIDAASGIGPTNNNPRSAIGITGDNQLIFFVCEGRNKTPDVPGFTLEEVAYILKDLGCLDAINLDGGGSTCMLVNGKATIQPSDGVQRSVTTAVAIK
jgi:exopolysaccharide biosynthesis protein